MFNQVLLTLLWYGMVWYGMNDYTLVVLFNVSIYYLKYYNPQTQA